MRSPFSGFQAVFYKEVLHMRRDSMAMLLALMVPLIEMTLLGAAIDTNIRHVPTVVYDDSDVMERALHSEGGQPSRALLDRFRNSDTFRIYKFVHSDSEMTAEMVSGRAQVGIKIPFDFNRQLMRNEAAQLLVLVDGSDSSVAAETVNVAQSLGLDESLKRILPPDTVPPLDVRIKVMFNPDSRSANFFLPGLMPILLHLVTVMLTASTIVREKELGTLEQLVVTPVRPLGLMTGKIMPYFFMALFEVLGALAFMHFAFAVPMHGSVILLVLLSMCYIFVNLSLGIWVSSKARTQRDAAQKADAMLLPTIYFSGYIFPRTTMPKLFYLMSYLVPATYMTNISRGIILRGAGFQELWLDGLILLTMGVIVLQLAARNFTRMIV